MAYVGRYRDGWRAQIQKDGVRVSKTFKVKRDAQIWATEQESKKTLSKGRTLRDACDRYLRTVSTEKRDAETWEAKRFEAFCEHFGDDKPLSEINSDEIGKWRDFRLTGDEGHSPVSGSTVIREVNLYRNMFKLAFEEWKWISEYPFRGVRLPAENPSRETIWRWRDIRRVIREGQRRGGKTLEVTQAFRIALMTSFRLQEALAAPAGFNQARKTITLPPSKTESRPSVVPTTHRGRKVIRGTPLAKVDSNEASTLFSDLCKQLGIKGLQFRDSRATALTLMARRMDILTLQKFSRHKDIRQLSIYYRETAEEISGRH